MNTKKNWPNDQILKLDIKIIFYSNARKQIASKLFQSYFEENKEKQRVTGKAAIIPKYKLTREPY